MIKRILFSPIVALAATIIATVLIVVAAIVIVLLALTPVVVPILYIAGATVKWKTYNNKKEKDYINKVWAWR